MSTMLAKPAAGLDPATLLAAVPNPESFEVVEGELLERVMSLESTVIAACVATELRFWTKAHPVARVFASEGQYQCFEQRPGQIRKPDVSVILRGKLPEGPLPEGFVRIVPDLVVEVVSPNDTAEQIVARLDDFRTAGTPLVWVVYPKQRRVYVHSVAGIRELSATDEIDAEPVLPGFRAKVADFFVA